MSNNLVLPKLPYWETVTSYYYDYVHWELDNSFAGPNQWLKQEYQADSVTDLYELRFNNLESKTLFLLRWDQS